MNNNQNAIQALAGLATFLFLVLCLVCLSQSYTKKKAEERGYRKGHDVGYLAGYRTKSEEDNWPVGQAKYIGATQLKNLTLYVERLPIMETTLSTNLPGWWKLTWEAEVPVTFRK